MSFGFAIAALLCWSGSDLFSKIGCQDAEDKYSHLKMVMAVGLVMGLHAAYEVFVGGVEINGSIILTYLPVSMLYILSMAIGYLGLRYIELSISSPICNSSGAIVAILIFATQGIGELPPMALVAVAMVCIGVVVSPKRGRTRISEEQGRTRATTTMQKAGWRSPSPSYTAFWTRLAPLPTAVCWRRSTRTRQTSPTS